MQVVTAPLTLRRLVGVHAGKYHRAAEVVTAAYCVMIFLAGNVILYSTPGACRSVSPIASTYMITVLAVMFAYFAVPVVLAAVLCLFLPFVLLTGEALSGAMGQARLSSARQCTWLGTRTLPRVPQTGC